MTVQQINKEVKEAAPTCGRHDTCEFGRYRIWIGDNYVVKGQTKKELKQNLIQKLKEINEFRK